MLLNVSGIYAWNLDENNCCIFWWLVSMREQNVIVINGTWWTLAEVSATSGLSLD